MAGFCKLVAQNWHKNLPSCVRVLIFGGKYNYICFVSEFF